MSNLLLPYEIWRDVPNYEGFYRVSGRGNIISVARKFYTGMNYQIERQLNESNRALVKGKDGYLRVSLSRDGKEKSFLVHRLVGLTFVKKLKGRPKMNHKDGIKTNNFPFNLEWCTQKENVLHAIETGLTKFKSGENCYQAKFTQEQIKEVRESELPVKKLAETFSVNISTIYKIKNKQRYVA